MTTQHSWDPLGNSTELQYKGQQPIRFPEDATNFECFLGGYIVSEADTGEGIADD